MNTEELEIAHINGEISALELIEHTPEKAELFISFLRSNDLERNEASASSFLEYEEEMALAYQEPIDGL